MDVFTVAWVVWIAAFVVIEGVAIASRRKGSTLSEHVWDWFSLKGPKSKLSAGQGVARFGFMAFMCWLTIHFLSGGSWL